MAYQVKLWLFATLFLSSYFAFSTEQITKNTSIYTSWYLSESDHCGGYTVTFIHSKLATKGFLQSYEGNCFSKKASVEIIKFDKKTGAVQFSVPDPDQTDLDSHRVEAEWRFIGYIQKNKLKGKMEYCFISSGECTLIEKIILTKTNHQTLE